MSWSLPEARKLAFHQMGTTGKCEGHWRGAWSLPSGHFSCPQCSLRPWRAREKGLSLKPAPGPGLAQWLCLCGAFALLDAQNRLVCSSSAWQIKEFQGLDGSGILALVELTFIDSTVCVCP